jgi:hypothetical protein
MSDNQAEPVPFFIVGCGRSGTTLFQTLIDGHPNIAIPPESYLYARFGRIFHTYGDLEKRQNRKRLIGALLHDGFMRQWRLNATVEDVEQRLPEHTRVGIIKTFFALYAEMHGASHWGDKTPGHINHLREIRRDFPAAKLIHLVRDGRDVAEAMRRMMFYPVSAVGCGHVWRNEVMQWQAFCETAGRAGTMLVRYEDLVTSPQQIIDSVFRFLDEPSIDTVSSYAESSLSQKLDALGPWHASLRQGINSSKIGIYRRKFTAREIEILEFIEGDALRMYGYATEHESPRAPTFAERLYAFAADRLVRWYRKLHLPRVFWQDVQFRSRVAYRLAIVGFRKAPEA